MVGASLVNYRAGTPPPTHHLKVQPGLIIVPWQATQVKRKSLTPTYRRLPSPPSSKELALEPLILLAVTSLLQGDESRLHSRCTDEGGVPEAHKLFELRLNSI